MLLCGGYLGSMLWEAILAKNPRDFRGMNRASYYSAMPGFLNWSGVLPNTRRDQNITLISSSSQYMSALHTDISCTDAKPLPLPSSLFLPYFREGYRC